MNKFLILIKRTLCKPIYIGLLLLLPAAAFLVNIIPDKSMSTNIYIGYINYDNSTDANKLNELLSESTYGFIFICYDDTDKLYADVASKKLDCGYIIPENFSDTFPKDINNSMIQVICSPATTYSTVSMEVIYNNIISVYAPALVKEYYKNNDEISALYGDIQSDFIDEYYNYLMEGDSLFTITTNSPDTYNGRAIASNTFPFYGFNGLIIFIAAMMGLINYLKDNYEHIYDRIPANKRIITCIMNIFSSAIPSAALSFIALIIYNNGADILRLLLHILVYIIICTIFCILYNFIFRNYHIFSGAMPILIICTLVFTTVFIDLSIYIPIIKYIAYLFPVTYF